MGHIRKYFLYRVQSNNMLAGFRPEGTKETETKPDLYSIPIDFWGN